MHVTACISLISTLLLTSRAQLIPFLTEPSIWSAAEADRENGHLMAERSQQQQQQQQQQQPLGAATPGIQLPPSASSPDDDFPPGGGKPQEPSGSLTISDVIATQRTINLFAGFTRQIETVSQRLLDGGANTTVLAPLNAAIGALPRKPWEDPRDYAVRGAEAYTGDDGVERAHANLQRFTEAHIVPAAPWAEGEKVRTMGGGTVWWERQGDKAVIHPGAVEVDRVVSKVANGEVWTIKNVLNYAA